MGRATLLAAILAGAPLPLWAESAAPTDDDTIAKQFAAAIESSSALDAQSPDTLNTRLAYANFLTKLESGDCRAHLDEAQNQLDAAKVNRELAIVLPAGLARIAHVEYQLHSARASCGASPAVRDQELHAALQAAQHAVELYRDEFDAVSMVTMQFNVSIAYHNLGDTAAAAAALRTTLDLDREYGFADDAEDNYRLLLQWSNQTAGSEQIEALMKDFPERSATLSFGWSESDAALTLQTDVSQVEGTDTARFRASRTAQRRVRNGLASWVVSYQLDAPHVEFTALPGSDQLAASYAISLARMLLRFQDFRVSRKGDFDWSKSYIRFESRARSDAKALARDLGSLDLDPKGGHSIRWARLIGAAVKDGLAPDVMEAQAGEDYNLEAGTWIGATLEQGVWYDMTAGLLLPISPAAYLTHQIQFSYSRPVPCVAGASKVSCIEIVLRAVPDPAALKANLEGLARRARPARGQVPRLWSIATMRLVTDPATLWTYSRETRSHAYWSDGVSGDQPLIESEKTIVSMSAPNPVSAAASR